MAGLENTWIGYFDRTYQQGKEAIFNRLGITVPEMSDHTESNPFVIIVSIFLGIAELLHYYIDNAAREVFLHSARQYKSGQKIAKLFNYRLKWFSASSALVKFETENGTNALSDIIIPADTLVKADTMQFRTKNAVTILQGTKFIETVVVQRVSSTLAYVSNGNPSQKVELLKGSVDKATTVTVNSVQYSFVEDFLVSKEDDTVFSTEITSDGKFNVVFGDGVNGIIPALNSNIGINFYVCGGIEGNVAPNQINNIVGLTTAEPITVTNENYATGGANTESLETLKKVIPASIRTLNRAVTKQDFKDIAEIHNGVAQAFPTYDCGASVEIFIVPNGLGSATAVLLDEVKDLFYDETRLIMMDVVPKSAGRIKAKIVADLTVKDVYNRALTVQKVKDNLLEFASSKNQKISGTVYIGDIYQVIENTEGVAHCSLELLSATPEATQLIGSSVLDWDRELRPASSTKVSWKIKFVGGGNYELTKENIFVGTFPIGATITRQEIEFKINPNVNYQAGDTWKFNTYKYNGNIDLDEPSIITLEESNIILNAIGGV